MVDVYSFNVDEKIYNKILNKRCKYLIMINDKKHQVYKEGNKITLNCKVNEDEEKSLQAVIEKLYFFDAIKDALDMLGKENCGYTSSMTSDMLEDSFYKKNKENDIEKHGLVVLSFVVE